MDEKTAVKADSTADVSEAKVSVSNPSLLVAYIFKQLSNGMSEGDASNMLVIDNKRVSARIPTTLLGDGPAMLAAKADEIVRARIREARAGSG